MIDVMAIIQARMSSSRLPGKVMLTIGEKPMLQWVVNRTRRARAVDEVVVATTTDPSDDPISAFCKGLEIPVYRGSNLDVLDRFYQTAQEFKPNIIVRITADCPFVEGSAIG